MTASQTDHREEPATEEHVLAAFGQLEAIADGYENTGEWDPVTPEEAGRLIAERRQ